MSEAKEAYMLPRDEQETKRLNQQHEIMKQLYGGDLIDPSIPVQALTSVADVATGTGIWLEHVFSWLRAHPSSSAGPKLTCVGFDISDAQFPVAKQLAGVDVDEGGGGLKFEVHDVTKPFPRRYWERFDLVHVRLLSFALTADVLDDAVRNVVQLIKPGGYLQWEEGDAVDAITVPEMENHKKAMAIIQADRAARGLTPAITQPLLRALTNLKHPTPPPQPVTDSWHPFSKEAQVNVLTGSSEYALRVLQVQTLSSIDHTSDLVRAFKGKVIWAAVQGILHRWAATQREDVKSGKYAGTGADAGGNAAKQKEEEMLRLADEADALAGDQEIADARWERLSVRYVARKAVFRNPLDMGENEIKFPQLREERRE